MLVIPFNAKKTFGAIDGLNKPVTIKIVEQVYDEHNVTLKIKVGRKVYVITEHQKKYLMPFGKDIYLMTYHLDLYRQILKDLDKHGLSM